MARRQSVGEIRVTVVPGVGGIADPTAPTLTELSAGVEAIVHMTRDGLSTPMSGNTVDASDASSRQNKQARGTRGGDTWSITAHRDSEPAIDELYGLLHPDFDGWVVIRRFGGSAAAFAAGDRVEVAPIEVITRPMADMAENQTQRFTAELAVTDEVVEDATVVA